MRKSGYERRSLWKVGLKSEGEIEILLKTIRVLRQLGMVTSHKGNRNSSKVEI